MLLAAQPAQALMSMTHDRFHVHFPEGQSDIANAILSACFPMTAYLKSRGLRVTRPLHIILDDALDRPQTQTYMIPHREIRIPLRAPGVLEDGFLEENPWLYFLFMGLSAQAIYSERSGIPDIVHGVFGEIISPTIILPEWCIDGVGFFLYEEYRQRSAESPFSSGIFEAGPIPDLDRVSNHPEIWPGRFSYRIYGRPFVRWLVTQYDWESLLSFLQRQGRGIVPLEIDSKARNAFGLSWSELWRNFQQSHVPLDHNIHGLPMDGYWDSPFVFWNDMGLYPGLRRSATRSRYGHVDPEGRVIISQYDLQGISRLHALRGDRVRTAHRPHIWDPGPGSVAVTRQGRQPFLIVNPSFDGARFPGISSKKPVREQLIPAPPGAIQLSGPVRDHQGRIAVVANIGGQWDIWLYDGVWRQITNQISIELDPWIENDRLLFVSNATGRFQIHGLDMQPLTEAPTAAMLPRGTTYLQLGSSGWHPTPRHGPDPPSLSDYFEDRPAARRYPEVATDPAETSVAVEGKPYSPWNSIVTNYISPDIFFDADVMQFGFVTDGRDVSQKHAWNAGLRYSVDHALLSWRLGAISHHWNTRATYYPLHYNTRRQTVVDELRYDFRLGWSPMPNEMLEIALNRRHYTQASRTDQWEDHWWGSIGFRTVLGNLYTHATIDLFDGGSQSVYGDIFYWFGERITVLTRLRAGKTWGDLWPGHNTFRIGGNVGEGFFTQRPTRLFPLRGFEPNVLDAGQAASATLEVVWPLAELHAGYATMPLFLRNMRMGTFVDSGFAAERLCREELLIGAGFHLITGIEIAWGFMADFSIGLAWPLRQPRDLDQDGPLFLIQIGRPM